MDPPLILASASPRRRLLLRRAAPAFDVASADVDETARPGESPLALALRLAASKADIVARANPGALVLGADTVVALSEGPGAGASMPLEFTRAPESRWLLLGKPRDVEEAHAFLRLLGGRQHRVITAVAVARVREDGEVVVRGGSDQSAVWIRRLTDGERSAYVATGSPMDKAGGYAIQDAGFRLVERIAGSETNVVGLPIRLTKILLAASID